MSKNNKKQANNIIIPILIIIINVLLVGITHLFYLYRTGKNKILIAREQASILEEEYQKLLQDNPEDEEISNRIDLARSEKEDEIRTQIRDILGNGGGLLTILEEIFYDQIVVPDSSGYKFFEINSSLAKNEQDIDAFLYPQKDEETGKTSRASYSSEGKRAYHGIDVSKFQGDIDWKQVARDDIEFAFIRLGFRGYEKGEIFLDTKFEDNIKGCTDAGIDKGVYFFTEAINETEAIEEAEFVIEALGDYKIELPVVLDIEQSANTQKSRTSSLTQEERTNIAKAFCDRIRQEGMEVMIYGNLKSMFIILDFEKLEEYDKWLAYYKYPMIFPYKLRAWQYTSAGRVAGIKGDVDLNLMFY